jgi:hypothetical protein
VGWIPVGVVVVVVAGPVPVVIALTILLVVSTVLVVVAVGVLVPIVVVVVIVVSGIMTTVAVVAAGILVERTLSGGDGRVGDGVGGTHVGWNLSWLERFFFFLKLFGLKLKYVAPGSPGMYAVVSGEVNSVVDYRSDSGELGLLLVECDWCVPR